MAGRISRRRFLVALGGLTGAAALAATRLLPDESPPARPGPSTSPAGSPPEDAWYVPLGVWAEWQSAARGSPDHPIAMADRAARLRDPAAILAFVRDRIATYPPRDRSRVTTDIRWGARAALRGAAGTPREKADILVDLYRRAGFEARIVRARVDATEAEQRTWYRRPNVRFEPALPPDVLSRWTSVPNFGNWVTLEPADVDGSDSSPLAARLLAAIPDPTAPGRELAVRSLPVVRVVTLDGPMIADPTTPGSVLRADIEPDEAPDAADVDPAIPIELAILVTRIDLPEVPLELVTSSWTADELVGRQVAVSFLGLDGDTAGFAAQASLMVIGPDAEEMGERVAVVGDAATVTGRIVHVSGSEVSVDGVPLARGPSNGDSSSVDAIALTVTAGSYPTVRLTLALTAADGRGVDGLAAGSLVVEEDGRPVPFIMRTNQRSRLRIVFVVDASSSMPPLFVDGERRRALGEALARGIAAVTPDVEAQATDMFTKSAGVERYKPLEAPALGAAFADLFTIGSEIYAALEDAAGAEPSLIVLISDGLATDSPASIARREAALRAGPPVISVLAALPGAETDASTMRRVADWTGGSVIELEDGDHIEGVIEAVVDALRARVAMPYQLEYQAPAGRESRREVLVRVGSAVASGAYVSPPTPPTAGRLAGVHLRIKVGDRTVVRRVAGWAIGPPPSASAIPGAALEEASRFLQTGTARISIEGSAPSLAMWIDEVATARIAARPFVEAVHGGASAEEIAGASTAFSASQPAAWSIPLHAPVPPAGAAFVHEAGVRAVMLVQVPTGHGQMNVRSDILPVTRFQGIATDRAAAYAAVVTASVRLALAERAMFPTATVTTLGDSRLHPRREDAPWWAALDDRGREPWIRALNAWPRFDRLVPDVEPAEPAFWAIDNEGSVFGVLADGSGGGSAEIDCADERAKPLEDIETVMRLYMQYEDLPDEHPLLALGKFAGKGAALTALALTLGTEAEGFADAANELWKKFLCELGSSVVLEYTPGGDRIGHVFSAFGAGTSLARLPTRDCLEMVPESLEPEVPPTCS